MKVLVIDIETAPHVAHVWGLFDQSVGLSQLIETGYVLCFAAKFVGENKMHFHKGPGLVAAAHKLFDQADVVVGWNQKRFDVPHLQREFIKAGMTPPSPYAQIDLLLVARQNFKFASNKLAHVAEQLLEDGKAPTGGHQLWIDVMANKRDAWAKMRHYNEQDVLLTERLYERLKPWFKGPNPALYGDADLGEITCPGCGSNDMAKRGLAYTTLTSYQRFQCRRCQRWARGKNRLLSVNAR